MNRLSTLYLLACLLAVGMCTSQHAEAQERYSDIGIGAQLGDPAGLSLRLYDRSRYVLDFLAAWDLDDFVYLNAHALVEGPIPDVQVKVYYGPGVLVGVDRNLRLDEVELIIGITGNFGVSYFVERFEVFLQLTPRLGLIPRTTGELGGGLGLRYYL